MAAVLNFWIFFLFTLILSRDNCSRCLSSLPQLFDSGLGDGLPPGWEEFFSKINTLSYIYGAYSTLEVKGIQFLGARVTRHL